MSAPNMENVEQVDVLVVGAGNAALSAALAAKEAGATSVKVIERAPEALRGGNSRFTGGMVRFAYDGVEQLREVATDMSDEEAANADFGTYTADQFSQDMERVTQYRADPDLAALPLGSRRGGTLTGGHRWFGGQVEGFAFTCAHGTSKEMKNNGNWLIG